MARSRRDDPLREIVLGDLPDETRAEARNTPDPRDKVVAAPEDTEVTEKMRREGIVGFRRSHAAGGQAVPIYAKETDKSTPVPLLPCKPGVAHIHQVVCTDGEIDFASDADGIWTARACEACGCKCRGIEPLFTLKMAARLIPASSVVNLTMWLNHHKDVFPPRYRSNGRKSPRRILTATEILKARRMLICAKKGGGREIQLARDIQKAEDKLNRRNR